VPRTRQYQSNALRQAAYRRRSQEAADAQVARRMPSIPVAPGRRRWNAILKASSLLLDHAAREMEDHFEQHSEQWQESEAGESLAQMLESAQDALAILDDTLHQNRQAKPAIT
jgi:hypothetical protein